MIALLRRVLGINDVESHCDEAECLSRSETTYLEAVAEAENGMVRAQEMNRRSSNLPSWEELMRERQRR